MEQIASFTIDHNRLQPGMYLARRDGDIVTLDLRFKKPNMGDLLSNSELHSTEHLVATALRNGEAKEAVIYFGPMGCQTGFFFLFDERKLTLEGAVALMKKAFARPVIPPMPTAFAAKNQSKASAKITAPSAMMA